MTRLTGDLGRGSSSSGTGQPCQETRTGRPPAAAPFPAQMVAARLTDDGADADRARGVAGGVVGDDVDAVAARLHPAVQRHADGALVCAHDALVDDVPVGAGL